MRSSACRSPSWSAARCSSSPRASSTSSTRICSSSSSPTPTTTGRGCSLRRSSSTPRSSSPRCARRWPTRRELRPLMDDLAHTRSEPQTQPATILIAPSPAAPTMSRRALLGTVGAGSLFLFVQGLGDSLGGPLRALSVLGPRDRFGSGPNGFAVNRTAAAAQISPRDVGFGLDARAERGRTHDAADARRAAGDGAAHLRPADRLCRGMVDDAALDAACACASCRRCSASRGN